MKKKAGALMTGNITVETIRGLKAMIRPLGGADALPKRKTLTDWWRQVRYALEAVDNSVKVEWMEREVIDRIGHILLGEAAWGLVSRQPFINWATFVQAVERRFGGSEAHQRELFLHLTRKAGEDGLDFVQRVEDTRCRLGISEEAALMKAWGQLPASLIRKLKDHHDMNGLGPVEWSDLVRYASRQLTKRDAEPTAELACVTAGTSAPPPPHTTRPNNTTRATAPRPTFSRAAPPPPPKNKQAHVAQQNAVNRAPCWICQDLKAFNPAGGAVDGILLGHMCLFVLGGGAVEQLG